MTFTDPLLLLALVPVAALLLTYLVAGRRRTRYAVRFATLPMLDRVAPARPNWRRPLAAGLVLTALSANALAAAGPELPLRVPYEQATVIVAIDISGSMEAVDVQPDRLQAAKTAAAQFVDQLPDTFNVGVAAFAGGATLVAPATTDHQAVIDAIGSLRTGGGGTAIGEAMFTAADEVLRQATLAQPDNPDAAATTADDSAAGPTERIPAWLVLLSDGANTSGREPGDAVPAATEAGMPVSTIAYGTPDGTIDLDGRTVPVPVDEATLQTIADNTGGEFYRAESSDQLREVYSDIGSSIGWRTQVVPITIPLILFGIATAITAAALSLRWFSRLV